MRKHSYITFLLLVLFCSCKKDNRNEIFFDKNGKPIITNQYKLDFINEILDDTSQVNIRVYNDPYIFISTVASKDRIPSKINDSLKFLNQIEYLSLHLKSIDTTFIKKQLNDKIKIEQLKEYGFKTVNWDKLIDYHFDDDDKGIEYLVSEDSIYKIESLMKKDGMLYLSGPIFNEKLNLAYLEVEHGVTGDYIIFENKAGEWITKSVINSWIR